MFRIKIFRYHSKTSQIHRENLLAILAMHLHPENGQKASKKHLMLFWPESILNSARLHPVRVYHVIKTHFCVLNNSEVLLAEIAHVGFHSSGVRRHLSTYA